MPEVKVPFYGHVRQYHSIKHEIDQAILSVLESNQYVMGPALARFEQEFAKYYGTKHAIGLNSGTDAVCTSFIIQKNLGTFGDGGAVLTNRADIDSTVRRLRNHGSLKRSVHSFGFNSRLDDLHAAILSVKLKHITRWSDRRREIAAR